MIQPAKHGLIQIKTPRVISRTICSKISTHKGRKHGLNDVGDFIVMAKLMGSKLLY